MKNFNFLKRVLWLIIPLLTLFNLSAWGGELVISLPSSSNVFSLRTSSGNDASSEITKSYGGYSYKLKAADKCYYYNSKALFIGKSGSYITFPAIANKKLSKVTIWNCTGAGAPKIAIYPTGSTTAVSGGSATTVSAGSSTTWTLSSTSVNTSYRMYITTSANLQMEGLRLIYINNAAYTVTFNAYDGSCGTSSLTEGSANAGVTLPSASPSSACAAEGWEFAGWAKSKCAETEVAPRLFLAGETYYPDGTETLHAVYRKLTDGSSTSTATFTASTLSGLTTLSSSPFTSSWWIHTASGVEFYLNYYGIYSNTFDIDDTDGEDYGWATLYGHRKIKQVVLTSSSSSYLLGSVTPDAGTATLTTSSATNTITCSGNVTSIDLYPNTTNNEAMISAFTITYYDTYFNSQPSCCTALGTINGSIL